AVHGAGTLPRRRHPLFCLGPVVPGLRSLRAADWRAAIQLCVPSAAAASRALWGASTCEGFLRLRGPESAAAAE
ncbi:unnamed protein product, partial [Symbiodinium necroappetens]